MIKKSLLCVICAMLLLATGYYLYHVKHGESTIENNTEDIDLKDDIVLSKVVKSREEKNIEQTETPVNIVHTNIYSDNSSIPLFIISVLSKLNQFEKEAIKEILSESDVYWLERSENTSFAIVGNTGDDKYVRHDLKFVFIDEIGEKSEYLFNQSSNEENKLNVWKFDRNTKLPIKHTNYISKGVIGYTENWNYSADESIKYEVRDEDDKIVSVRKEFEEDNGIRIENIKYDEEGNIERSVSLNYDGPNLTRLIFYDLANQEVSKTLVAEFKDGLRVKEQVYSSDYKLINSFVPVYKDGERIRIDVFNSQNKKIEEILPE